MNMNWNKKTNPNNVLLAVLAGAGAGLVVGLLMAPKSGEETRTDIGDAVDEYLESARERAEGLKTSASNMAQRGIREVQRTKDMIADKVRDTVNKGEQEANDVVDKAASVVSSATRKKGRDAVNEAAAEVRAEARS
ncbi:MAG: YtxH-like protein [Bryobacterales bacterium]|jgi:gas vesicle protein|nr:YtxH-like protein [Bryobacterales bacterium]